MLGKISLVVLLALYGWVAFSSPGYDDEFFNVNMVENGKTFTDLYTLANSINVHPPGQYLINKALWHLSGNWSIVRITTAVFAASIIWLLWRSVAWSTPLTGLFAYLAICLNPALLLWCTGIRWYAYFVPLFSLMAMGMLRNPASPFRFWGPFFLLSMALFMIGYAAVVLIPVAFAIALYVRRERLHDELAVVLGFGLTALLLSSHQLIVFVTVHARNSSSQTAGLVQAITGLGLHVLSNQGAMPVSPFGMSLVLANLLLFGVAVNTVRTVRIGPVSGLFVLGALGLAAAQLTGKFRNLVTVAAFQGVFQAQLFQTITNKPLMMCTFFLMAVGNIGGTYNVAMHNGTTKGSWNTPYGEVLSDLQHKRDLLTCSRVQVITHDPVLAYHASGQGAAVVYVGQDQWREKIKAFTGCRAAVQTFRGSMSNDLAQQYARLINELPKRVDTAMFGPDRYAWFKRKLDPDVPDYYVRVTYFAQ